MISQICKSIRRQATHDVHLQEIIILMQVRIPHLNKQAKHLARKYTCFPTLEPPESSLIWTKCLPSVASDCFKIIEKIMRMYAENQQDHMHMYLPSHWIVPDLLQIRIQEGPQSKGNCFSPFLIIQGILKTTLACKHLLSNDM